MPSYLKRKRVDFSILSFNFNFCCKSAADNPEHRISMPICSDKNFGKHRHFFQVLKYKY